MLEMMIYFMKSKMIEMWEGMIELVELIEMMSRRLIEVVEKMIEEVISFHTTFQPKCPSSVSGKKA